MYTEMAVENDHGVSYIIRAAASSLGYAEICLLQETVVRAFVTGSDVFPSIPTGGGKSLCYAVLPRAFDMLRGNDTPVSGDSHQSYTCAHCAIARLLVTLRRDVTRMKFH